MAAGSNAVASMRLRVREWARGNRFALALYRLIAPGPRRQRRQSQALVSLSTSMSNVTGAKLADFLRLAGKPALSLDVARALVDRDPRSSTAQYQLARVLNRLDLPGGRDALFAALAGDLVNVSLPTLAAFAVRRLDPSEWDLFLAAMPTESESPLQVRERAKAGRVVAMARQFNAGEQVDVTSAPEDLSDDGVELILARSASKHRWEELDRLIATLGGLEAIAAKYPLALERLLRVLKVRGDLASLQKVAQLTSDRDPSAKADYAERWAADALQLSQSGWRAPQKAPRAAGEPGRMGYLVHNSLPYNSGGYATRSHGLLTGLASRGWRPTAVTRPPYPLGTPASRRFRDAGQPLSQAIDGVTYRRVLEKAEEDLSSLNVEHFASHVARIARQERWGVVHGASNHTVGLAGIEAAARLGLPSVYEVRGLWELTRISREPSYEATSHYAMYQRLEADACILADHAFAITEAVRDIMVERGVPRNHITLLPNGVDVTRFHPLTPKASLRTKLGLDGKVVLGYVGSIVDYEGLPLLVQAAKELDSQGLPVALLIVGDGHVVYQVENAVKEFGAEKITTMTGRVPHEQVEDYYSIIDIAPFPRLPLPVTEAVSPLKPFEAMAMAKPIVVSSVAALTEIVTEGVNGRIFTKGDAGSLAEVLANLVEDREGREELGRAARAWVEENRSWEKISTRISDVYERLGVVPPR